MAKGRIILWIALLAGSAVLATGAQNAAQSEDGSAFAPLQLGAVSNFSQGLPHRFAATAADLGITNFRDGMVWRQVEERPGVFTFDGPRVNFPDAVADAGATVSLTIHWGNPLYDEGFTPHSPEALAAQQPFTRAILERFPKVDTIEVGNEFNGTTFVSGPVREMNVDGRAAAHVAILKEIYEAAQSAGREITVLGGATHSIPTRYIWDILDAGGAEIMDAIAIHPYSTTPEQFGKQIAVMRRHPDAKDLPIQVTEFGTRNIEGAPAFFLKWIAVMAVNGVERAVWYPLTARQDGYEPLMDREGALTPVGEAFAFAQQHLAGRNAHDVSPDAYTFAVRFGEYALVLWGAPRSVRLADGITAFGPTGAPLAASGLSVSADTPIILLSEEIPVALGNTVTLGPQTLLADSFFDFAYPDPEAAPVSAADGPLTFLAQRDGAEIPLTTQAGQDRGGVPWNPYLSGDRLFPLVLTSRTMVPRAGRPAAEVVARYDAPADGPVDVVAHFVPSERTEDGVSLTVTLNGTVLAETAGTTQLSFADQVALSAGDRLAFALGPNGTQKGDATRYRITIAKPGMLLR
ncbi:MAG: hypothetical protein AAGJ94_00010 [Pseudomonadota bacterium]